MSNQASEDDLAKQIESITQDMFVTLSEWQAGVPVGWHSAKVKGRADLLALIRTEKQKLLAEVGERVVGEVVTETWYNKYLIEPGNEYERKFLIEEAPVRYQNKLKKEQLTKLTKLEAEL